MLIGCVPWIVIILWLLRNQLEDAAGKNVKKENYKSDYFTGMGLRPEDIWGHELFDNILED